ncbi:MAG: D-aminoacyl-tRNA deacylase [Pseudomonadota bacterium]
MIALIQRVNSAEVVVNKQCIASISQGLLAFIGIEKTDKAEQIAKLVHKIIHYRLFADNADKMNLSVKDIQGGILLVPQFTLAANTNKGLRPSFSSSAPPDIAETLFQQFVDTANQQFPSIETGQFGADMKVSLINDGPVTFILKT